MPVATPFNALGAGNGFPVCPTKVNVLDRGDGSPYDYWTTLSGWSAVSEPVDANAKAASITLSREYAMMLWWNLDVISLVTSHSGNSLGIPPKSVTDIDISVASVKTEPVARVCLSFINSLKNADDPFGSSVYARMLSRIIGLYKGDTTDEGNFIGYSAYKLSSLAALTCFIGTEAASATTAGVGLGGYVDIAGDGGSSFTQGFAYVVVDSMHFVSMAYAKDGGNNTGTANASAVTASSSNDDGGGTVYTADATITGFNFYTYP